MNYKPLFFIFIIITLIVCSSSASATITLTDATPRIAIESETVSLTELYDYIVATKGETTTHSTYMEEISPDVWLIKAQLLGGGYFTINEDAHEADDVRFTYLHGAGSYTVQIRAHWNDVIIRATNGTDPAGNRRQQYYSHSRLNNVTWNTVNYISIGSGVSTNITVTDCSMTNWYTSVFFGGSGFTIDGFSMYDPYEIWYSERAGIRSSTLDDSAINNISITGIGYTGSSGDDSSGAYGIQISGDNNTADNLYVNGSRYSGFNIGGSNWTGSNWTAIRTHHNAMELQFTNSTIDGLMIQNNTIHGIFSDVGFEDPFPAVNNNYYRNVTVYDTGSGYALYQGRVSNTIFRDATLTGNALDVQYGTNLTFINVSHLSGTTGFVIDDYGNTPFNDSENIKIINSVFTGTNQILYSSNVSLVNSQYDSLSGFTDADYTTLYPLNVLVTNTTDYPVSDAEITITASTFSLNGLGTTVTTAHTDSTGKLNESELIYVADFLRDSSTGYTYYLLNATASKDAETDTELAINPDSTWRSTNLSDLNGTLYTFVLDVEGSGEPLPLEISSFTPIDTTPSSVNGTEQEFSINTNTESNITWYIDSVEVQTNTSVTSASYTNSTANVGEYVVLASAYDGSTYANQSWTWTVTEVPVTPTTDEENAAANVWITNIGMISVAMMMMIIAVPIIVIRNNRNIDARTIDTIIFAVVVIFIVGVVAILGTGTLQEIGLLMP